MPKFLRFVPVSAGVLIVGLATAHAETSDFADDPIALQLQSETPVAAPVPAAPVRAQPRSEPVADPGEFVLSANTAVFSEEPFRRGKRDPRMAKLQVLLDRAHASPGVIDGLNGGNVGKAIFAAERMFGLREDGILDRELWSRLAPQGTEDAFVTYEITEEDVAGPFVPEMPHDYAEMAALPGLSYRDAAELLAERFHMDEGFLRALNPDVDLNVAGSTIIVANVGPNAKTKVARIVADKERRQLFGYDKDNRLVVSYPATIGSSDLPSPTGTHVVGAIAVNPDYWYRPQVNFQQGNNTKALRLPPGPNNPVGMVWIGLDKPTYGIHGSPEPSKIDKTNSHGCVRLANFDALELVKLVAAGVIVDFIDGKVDLTALD
ncbi:L,D-transpeptidase family protein [Terrihabitans sp. B22-R8]|uniref:L,D-transpeptidase family protein n=1 Tax=Terrihabitans sp. B22-R8 TaxID=3425128 RepID=UPI00403D2FE9